MRMTYKGELTRRRINRKKDDNDRQTRWLLHFFSHFLMGFQWNFCGIDFLKKIKTIIKPVVFVSHLSLCLFLPGKIGKEWEDKII